MRNVSNELDSINEDGKDCHGGGNLFYVQLFPIFQQITSIKNEPRCCRFDVKVLRCNYSDLHKH